jgi:hypothetical protein
MPKIKSVFWEILAMMTILVFSPSHGTKFAARRP